MDKSCCKSEELNWINEDSAPFVASFWCDKEHIEKILSEREVFRMINKMDKKYHRFNGNEFGLTEITPRFIDLSEKNGKNRFKKLKDKVGILTFNYLSRYYNVFIYHAKFLEKTLDY